VSVLTFTVYLDKTLKIYLETVLYDMSIVFHKLVI